MHLSAEAVGFVPALALGYALVARAEPPGRFRIAAAVAGLALIFAAGLHGWRCCGRPSHYRSGS